MKAFGVTEYGNYEETYYILFADSEEEAQEILKENGVDEYLEEITIEKGLHCIGYYTE